MNKPAAVSLGLMAGLMAVGGPAPALSPGPARSPAAAVADSQSLAVRFGQAPALPPPPGRTQQLGLAGAVIGVIGDRLIVAGGSNFEGRPPWQGGAKSYHDDVYVLARTGAADYRWETAAAKLPAPRAYGACVSQPQGVVCLGGENAGGPVADAMLIRFQGKTPQFTKLPPLPSPLSNAAAAAIGSIVYVAGGTDATGAATTAFLGLDLAAQPDPVWRKLADLPRPLAYAVAVAQDDGHEACVYVLGGRAPGARGATGAPAPAPLPSKAVWKYGPSSGRWSSAGEIAAPGVGAIGLSAGTGTAYLDRYIVLFGGDTGKVFDPADHPGFSRAVLVFDTRKRSWDKAGEIPGPSPVTTTLVPWGRLWILPCGEIRPGVRTPEVTVLELAPASPTYKDP